jgi:hypothetical protein
MTEFAGDHAADAAMGLPCPPWCDGWHGADDRDAVFHVATIARVGDVTVAVSLMHPRDPARPADGPVIMLIGSGDDVQTLTPADAARLLIERESADRTDLLARAVRSALARLG